MIEKFNIEGMTCAACQAHVSKAVSKLDGVLDVNVNLLQNNMVVNFDENKCSIELIEATVEKAGYKAYVFKKNTENKKDKDLINLIISFILLICVMYFSMGNMMWNFPLPKFLDHHNGPVGFSLSQLILTVPILIIYRKFFFSGFKKLFNKSPNMDTLIAIGASASMLYGIFAFIMILVGVIKDNNDLVLRYHDSLYFESAGMILTLVSLGKYFEKLSKKKTTSSIEKLINLSPKTATILIDGEEKEILSENVKVNDIVIVKKGDSIPIDGIIIDGSGSINQANITGESMPVSKKENDEVFSSTILVSGYLKIKATKVGEDTSIANIIKLVEEASNSKAPISKLADRISGIFVPIILVISLLTFIINLLVSTSFEMALNFAITVVVIACPCALGLATPVAVMVGTGKGAECGLIIKNAEILEKAHLINTIVLDKTGTITEGKPKVVNIKTYENCEDIFSYLYSIESKSEHPLAHSICEYAMENCAKELEVLDYSYLDGMGVIGYIDNKKILIGNKNLLQNNKIDTKVISKDIEESSINGNTPLVMCIDENIICIIEIKDKVKDTSKYAISRMKDLGINVYMLTGDNEVVAKSIAKDVSIDNVISDVLPQDKQKVIETLKSEGRIVAMVGDGVNDAPALTCADVGIAIGAGSDVAIESSDITLLRNDLLDVINAIRLSKMTINTIKMNLFWAFFYNAICVIIACGVFSYINPSFVINPMIGSLAMSISSVSVVLNALRINLFKNEKIENKKEIEVMENKMIINVEGMMCMHCKSHVENAIKSIDGVISCDASLENKNVSIIYNKDINRDEFVKAIEDAGYEAK